MGTNNPAAGSLKVVVNGVATDPDDESPLDRLARDDEVKDGAGRRVEIRDSAFVHGVAGFDVARVPPTMVDGFGTGEPFAQTRWPFAAI